MDDGIDISELDLAGKVVVGEQIALGGFSSIAQGTLHIMDGAEVDGIAFKSRAFMRAELIVFKVAIKALQIPGICNTPKYEERLRKHFYREVLLWRTLQHPNIVPLLGYVMPPNKPPTLISPWYVNGNVIQYLESCPDSDRRTLALDVVDGLDYLHSIPIAHGDLKGENVLVDCLGRASLCDFGMSQFVEEASHISGFETTNSNSGGTYRFMSPELLDDKPKTAATDIWALGCLVTQILTDTIPYKHITRKEAVLATIMRGECPMENSDGVINELLWDCIRKCWCITQDDRPKVYELRNHLTPANSKMDKGKTLKTAISRELDIYGSDDARVFKTLGSSQLTDKTISLFTHKATPPFGDLDPTVKDITEMMKVALADPTKPISNIIIGERDWDAIVNALSNSSLTKQRGEHRKSDSYTLRGTGWFKANRRIYKAVFNEIEKWFGELIDDPNVVEATSINTDRVAEIVATAGDATGNHEESIVEIGVIFYPYSDDPHFELYCIRLSAWSNYKGSFLKSHSYGIKGVFLKRVYGVNIQIASPLPIPVMEIPGELPETKRINVPVLAAIEVIDSRSSLITPISSSSIFGDPQYNVTWRRVDAVDKSQKTDEELVRIPDKLSAPDNQQPSTAVTSDAVRSTNSQPTLPIPIAEVPTEDFDLSQHTDKDGSKTPHQLIAQIQRPHVNLSDDPVMQDVVTLDETVRPIEPPKVQSPLPAPVITGSSEVPGRSSVLSSRSSSPVPPSDAMRSRPPLVAPVPKVGKIFNPSWSPVLPDDATRSRSPLVAPIPKVGKAFNPSWSPVTFPSSTPPPQQHLSNVSLPNGTSAEAAAVDPDPFQRTDADFIRLLDELIPKKDVKQATEFQHIVGTVVMLQDPLPLATLAKLLRVPEKKIQPLLKKLHGANILSTEPKDQNPIAVYPALSAFLISRKRCTDRFLISPGAKHSQLATVCLTQMNGLLPNIESYAEASLPPNFRYCCLYWISHVVKAPPTDAKLCSVVVSFCKVKLPKWLVAVRVLGKLDVATTSLTQIDKYLTVQNPKDIEALQNIVRGCQQTLQSWQTGGAQSSAQRIQPNIRPEQPTPPAEDSDDENYDD